MFIFKATTTVTTKHCSCGKKKKDRKEHNKVSDAEAQATSEASFLERVTSLTHPVNGALGQAVHPHSRSKATCLFSYSLLGNPR